MRNIVFIVPDFFDRPAACLRCVSIRDGKALFRVTGHIVRICLRAVCPGDHIGLDFIDRIDDLLSPFIDIQVRKAAFPLILFCLILLRQGELLAGIFAVSEQFKRNGFRSETVAVIVVDPFLYHIDTRLRRLVLVGECGRFSGHICILQLIFINGFLCPAVFYLLAFTVNRKIPYCSFPVIVLV